MVYVRNDAEIPDVRHRDLEKAILAGLDSEVRAGEACGLAKDSEPRRPRKRESGRERKWKRRQVQGASTSSSSSSRAEGLTAMVLLLSVVNG